MRSCFGSFSLLFDKWIYMDRWMDRWVDGYICVKVRKNVQVEDNSAPSMGTTKQIKTNDSMLKLILLMVRLSPFMLYPNFLYRLLFNHIWSTNALSHLISSTWESNVLVSNFCLDNRHAYWSLCERPEFCEMDRRHSDGIHSIQKTEKVCLMKDYSL